MPPTISRPFILARQGTDLHKPETLVTVTSQIFADAAEKTQHIGQFVGLVLADSFEAHGAMVDTQKAEMEAR